MKNNKKEKSDKTSPPDENNLENLRVDIDSVDKEIIKLLNRRARISKQVGIFKAASAAPIFQPAREQALMDKLLKESALVGADLPDQQLRSIYKEIISSSRALQEPLKVGFLGPEGTFSQMAALEFMGSSSTLLAFKKITELFIAVEKGLCQLAIVPIENSLHGTINESFDAFISHNTKIVAEHCSRISLSLLSKEKSLAEVKNVYSHAQPLGQCSQWLNHNLRNARQTSVESTAAAAHKVLEEKNSAAIAHAAMAETLGLNVLAQNIEDLSDNWTRFFIISAISATPAENIYNRPTDQLAKESPAKEKSCEAKKSTIIFSVADRPGSLSKVLEIFAKAGANMSKLESRPMRHEPWKYIFFADFNCDLIKAEYSGLLKELEDHCYLIRILGVYESSLSCRKNQA